ncbi:hypothetical protein GCM10010193_63720 [Kitasatospora atroaurantiaca]|uniref:DUF3291 domain-containing protein n=1 Tax=Kitasatospora atroaurantiaca TaxID=285545 RepID=A0A561EU28_9ACTN|nr:hypothetical protein [Kitasatospora atroaurantiaca]TWE19119.1 hypothetical protein FB465_4223 [Kitasatospora atroaurantiaca]
MLRSSWTPGQDHGHGGPVLVSVTDFTLDRIADLPGVYRAARRLAADWAELEGAHGLWLWAVPTARRCGAVAVWSDAAALHRFIAWPPHVAIMRRYKGRGTLASTTWQAEGFDPTATWTRARAALGAGQTGVGRPGPPGCIRAG